jgi:hypothetical protein
MTSVSARVSVARRATFYGSVGDLFGWLCIAGIGVVIVLSCLRPATAKRRTSSPESSATSC